MKNIKGKRKSLRRQWSVDVPSSIQKKFREVTSRSKSLDEYVYKQKLLDDGTEDDGQDSKQSNASFKNFGQDDLELPRSSCSSSSSPWYSFDEDNSEGSWRENETDQNEIDEIQIEVSKRYENFENTSLSVKTKDVLSVNTCGLLSTIDELVPRSPTRRTTSPAAEFDWNKDKQGSNNVPAKFAKNEDGEEFEPEIGERFRRYAICEEMERYIIVDHKGLSLRKYRESLIRHRVLKELCLL